MTLTSLACTALCLAPALQTPLPGGLKGQGVDRGQVAGKTPLKLDPNVQITSSPKPVEIKFRLRSLSYRKAEDEDGKDEPYLLSAGFRIQIIRDLRGFFIAAGSEQVTPILPLGHHNIVSASNGWARTGGRYSLEGQQYVTTVNPKSSLEVVGYITLFQEQDGWNADQIKRFTDDFPRRFKTSLAELQRESVRQPQLHVDELIRRMRMWINGFQAARWITFMTPFGSGDSDDTGGTQFSMVINFGDNPDPKVPRKGIHLVTEGLSVASLPKYTELRRNPGVILSNMEFEFPAGDVNAAPPKARWKGQARILGFATREN